MGHRGDLHGVAQQARDEPAARDGEPELVRRVVERVRVALEEGEVSVHAGARVVGERLGHERGVGALGGGDLLDDGPERHHVVRRRERVRRAQVDLVLAGAVLVVAELDGDAHALEEADGVAAEVGRVGAGHVVEVARAVHGHRLPVRAGLVRLQEVELDLRVGEAREAPVRGPVQHAAQHVPRVGGGGPAVRGEHVAEHPGALSLVAAPGQDLEGRGIGLQQHVRLGDAGVSVDRGAVEAQALREGVLHLGRRQGHRLQGADHVREPEPDEPDVPVLDGAEHVVLLSIHAATLDVVGHEVLATRRRLR